MSSQGEKRLVASEFEAPYEFSPKEAAGFKIFSANLMQIQDLLLEDPSVYLVPIA